MNTKTKLQIFRQKDTQLEALSDFCLTWFFYPYLLLGSDWKRRKDTLKALHGSLLLDAGSGTGWFSIEAYKKGLSVVSLDISKKSNKAAKTLMNIEKVQIPLLRASLTNIPFTNQTFDSIICFEVLEHIEDVHAALSEFHRTLKKEGELVITTPNGYGAFAIIQDIILPKIGFNRKGIETHHVHKFTKDFLQKLIHQQGFQLNHFKNIEFLSPIFMTLFLMIRKFCKRELISMLKLLHPDVIIAKRISHRLGATWMINCKKN